MFDLFLFVIILAVFISGFCFGRFFRTRFTQQSEPTPVRAARQRMDAKVCQKCAEREANMWAEVIE